ncbi:MAG: sulfite exporter TauE/SafE family protein [Candidatus Eremiobacteraeota bacterium]|nr:sulfite exporter TauE/SafE family protein [Candidatus Eremiobacteraeota bacterium]
MLGAGGSILAVPILHEVGGLEAKTAIATSLAIVGAIALVGAAVNYKAVVWKTALFFALFGSFGTALGTYLAHWMSGAAQMVLFALMMLGSAAGMLKKERQPLEIPVALQAFGVGVFTGLVGVGGGFLIVPALVLLVGLEMTEAVPTSLAIIAANSAVGMVGYSRTTQFDWGLVAGFLAAALVGLVTGTKLAKKVDQARLKQGFGVMLVVVAVVILARNLKG